MSSTYVRSAVAAIQDFVREAFKKEIRWKLGHCPNSYGSLPSLLRLGRISENQKYFISLLCVLSHSEHIIFSVGKLM